MFGIILSTYWVIIYFTFSIRIQLNSSLFSCRNDRLLCGLITTTQIKFVNICWSSNFCTTYFTNSHSSFLNTPIFRLYSVLTHASWIKDSGEWIGIFSDRVSSGKIYSSINIFKLPLFYLLFNSCSILIVMLWTPILRLMVVVFSIWKVRKSLNICKSLMLS